MFDFGGAAVLQVGGQVQRGRALLHDNYANPELGADEMCAHT